VSAAGGAFIPAGSFASLRLPKVLTNVVQPTITAGQTATFTWTPTGADSMIVSLYNQARGGAVVCYPADSGSFTVPADVTTAAGSGGWSTLVAFDASVVTVGGRDILLFGDSY